MRGIPARDGATMGPSAPTWPSTPPVPEAFRCPIGLDMMDDPVMAADGVNYQRGAIEAHLRGAQGPVLSPMTGAVLAHPYVVSNHELRGRISDFCGRTLGAHPSSPSPPAAAVPASTARYVDINALIERSVATMRREIGWLARHGESVCAYGGAAVGGTLLTVGVIIGVQTGAVPLTLAAVALGVNVVLAGAAAATALRRRAQLRLARQCAPQREALDAMHQAFAALPQRSGAEERTLEHLRRARAVAWGPQEPAVGQLGTVLVTVCAVLLTMALATALAGGGRSGRSGGHSSYHHACSRRQPSPQIHIMPVGLSGGSGRSLGAAETYRIAVAAAEDVQPCARVPLREAWRVALGGAARHS